MVLQPPYWAYHIIDDLGRCYYVDPDTGIVSATAQRMPLEYTPDGWQELSLIWQRDFTKGIGMNRQFGLPFGFVRDGAKILRKTFYTETFERRLFLLIQQLTLQIDNTSFLWRYKFFTKQEFDFPKLKDSDFKVTVPLVQGGIQRLFDANKDTQYTIPFDRDSIIIKIDGLFLYKTFNFIVPGINDNTFGFTHTTNGNWHHLVGISPTTSDGEASGFAVEPVFYKDLPNTPTDSTQINLDFANSLDYFFTATQDIADVRIQGSISVRSTTPTDANYALFLYKNDGTGITLASGPIAYTSFTTFAIDKTIDVKANEKYFLIGSLGGYVESIQYNETRFTIDIHSRYKATYCKAFKAIDLLKKLLAKMGIDPKQCSSDLLKAVEGIVITCGNAIRTLPASAIKTSLSEFLEFCRTQHAAGYGIEQDKLVIEGFAHFLNTAVVKPLGEAKDLEVSYADDLLVNTVKVGYPNAEIDNVNGKFEPNNTYLFSTPITKVTKELNLVCPYLSQPYLIETIRLNLDGKTTTDNANDNQTFLLNADLSNPLTFTASKMETDLSGHRMYFTNASDFYDAVTERDTFALAGTQFNNNSFTISGIAVLPDGRIVVNVYEDVTAETANSTVTFILPVYPLLRPAFTSIEGVPADSRIFNISYLTPKEMLLRHLTWINSLMDGFAGQLLKYESTDKNAGLKTTLGEQVIEQKADVEIGTAKLFLPKQFDFENMVPVDLVEWMDEHPNSAFSVVSDGVTYTLFYRTLGMAPNTMKEQSFKMLLAPNNNFSNRL